MALRSVAGEWTKGLLGDVEIQRKQFRNAEKLPDIHDDFVSVPEAFFLP